MKRVFVSSVIGNFELYRMAARSAVELMDLKPIMAEDFASRAYSSETACISEVQKSDLVLLILGTRYGFKTSEGISVTQSEYRSALKAGRPVLVFLEDGELEPEQAAFRNEVENYDDGFFRTKFSKPEQLKDLVVKAIRTWESEQRAVNAEDFDKRLEQILKLSTGSRNEAQAIVAFWGQPTVDVDLDEIEQRADNFFETICKIGAASLRDGYEFISRPDMMSIKSKSNKAELNYYRDGLILLKFEAKPEKDNGSFAYFHLSPQKVAAVAKKAIMLSDSKIVWCLLGLSGMESRYFDEPTTGNSSSLPMYNQPSEFFKKLFSPITPAAYEEWVDMQIKKLKRTYSKK